TKDPYSTGTAVLVTMRPRSHHYLQPNLPGQLEEGGWPADPEVTGSVFLRTRPLPPANGSRAKSDL
uniref:Uncharacterized protein n=1 Tax=Leptobrachium leishanense TaxID=445787 RepID=A0A8C5PNN1_9ANUR